MPLQTGVLKTWKEERGFGFIAPSSGGADLFVHRRDFGNIRRKPRVGDIIHYQPVQDSAGRLRATNVQIEGLSRQKPDLQTASQKPMPSKRYKQQLPRARSKPERRSRFVLFLLCGVIITASLYQLLPDSSTATEPQQFSSAQQGYKTILHAYQNHQSNLQVSGAGTVVKLLADDLKGSRHQRFILKLPSGITILIAHNIDLAPRLNTLRSGDSVSFNGEYEWNDKGGVVHWTHHDPSGRHPNGWLEHKGKRFQ